MSIRNRRTKHCDPRTVDLQSTVLGLFAAWMIGRHAAAKKMLRILYIAYMVDISRAKSATIKGILTSTKYREVFPMVRLSNQTFRRILVDRLRVRRN